MRGSSALPALMLVKSVLVVVLVVPAVAAVAAAAAATPTTPYAPYVNLGSVEAVQALLERVNPGSASHFTLALADTCPGSSPPCFALEDEGDKVKVTATGAAELSYGVGYGTFRLNFHRFDRLGLDLRGHTQP